jgi:nucleotide-binding universal stress UspA family protein
LRHQIIMSYRKIVSVVNEHTVSMVITRYAISLAVSCKAELVLYAAHDRDCDGAIVERAGRHQDHLYTVASELGIPVTRMTDVGNSSTLLPGRVQEVKADLVFYPLTPYKRYGLDAQRHAVRHLLRTITSDLAIMRVVTMARPHPGQILVPLDRRISNKERRLQFISALARDSRARVTLFHLSAERAAQMMPDDIVQFGKLLQQEGVTVLERLGRGDIGRAITVEAATRRNDLIVLGASARGVLRKLFIGNPAGDIMQHPACNTILFRPAL